MEYRQLGRSGLRVSAVTYGTWLTLDADHAEAGRRCVRAALDLGITTFDTADVYGAPAFGAAEQLLGAVLGGVRRESVEILTKVCMRTGPGPNDTGLSRKHVLESCDASLRRLRTDYIDLFQAHRFDEGTPVGETMLAFADLVRRGKVRYLGVSEWTAGQIAAACPIAAELGVPLVANQAQYSVLWRVIETDVLPACVRLGLGQLVFSSLAQGVLTGKYRSGQPPPAGSRGSAGAGVRFVRRYTSDAVLAAAQRFGVVARELGHTPAQLAVAWALNRPGVSAVIVGSSRPEQLADNVAAVGVNLDADVLSRIDGAFLDSEHGDLVERDPARTARLFDVKQSWQSAAAS